MPRRSRRGRSSQSNMRASANDGVVGDEATIEEETSTLPIENSSNETGNSEETTSNNTWNGDEMAGDDTGTSDEITQDTEDSNNNLPVKQEPIETPKVSSHESEWIDLLFVGGILVVLLLQDEVDILVIFLLGLLLLDII